MKGFETRTTQFVKKRQKFIDILTENGTMRGYDIWDCPIVIDGKYEDGISERDEVFKINEKIFLRYDLTIPMKSSIDLNNVGLPLKRVSYGKVFRNDKPGPNRFKEFMQADIDIYGFSNEIAEKEVVNLLMKSLSQFGLTDLKIIFNDRNEVSKIFDAFNFQSEIEDGLLRILDKFSKIGHDNAVLEMTSGRHDESGAFVKGLNVNENVVKELIEKISQLCLKRDGMIHDPFLVRGMSYYTGLIFEIVWKDCVIGGGGRYDDYIKKGVTSFGGSIGIDRVLSLIDISKTRCVDFAIISDDKINNIQHELDKIGKTSSVYMGQSGKLSKQLKWANSIGANYAIIRKEVEFKKDVVSVKDLNQGIKDSSNILSRERWLENNNQIIMTIDELSVNFKDDS